MGASEAQSLDSLSGLCQEKVGGEAWVGGGREAQD